MIPSASDVQNFIQGNINYITESKLPTHIQEQVELRKFLCNDCLKATKCPGCPCKVPNMFYAPNKKDFKNKWAEFMSEAQWTALKNNIDLYKEFFSIPKT
jgi:hypothetical protein